MKENEKQAIEEMVPELRTVWIMDWEGNPHELQEKLWDDELENIAIELTNIGYRKQSEGEWIVDGDDLNRRAMCSNCKHEYAVQKGMLQLQNFSFCPNCGTHMKGGAE